MPIESMTYDPNQPINLEEARPTDLEETAVIPIEDVKNYDARFGDCVEFEDLFSSVQGPLGQLWGNRTPQKED